MYCDDRVVSMPLEAMELYSRMMEADGTVEPEAVLVTSMLPACGDTSTLSLRKKIHGYIERKQLTESVGTDRYMQAKSGCLDRARDGFEDMNSSNVVSWKRL